MSHKALLQDQTTVRWKLVVSHYTWRSVCPPVCHLVSHPVCSTDSYYHISAWKSVSVPGKKLKFTKCLSPLLCCCAYCWRQSALLSKTSVKFPPENSLRPCGERFRQHPVTDSITDGDYVIKSRKCDSPVTFQDVWWVRISTTTHYNTIHMIINSQQVHF